MKLTRIDAISFGGLENGTLSGLGDGLTVVLGPNESGKSTYSALTRHVLYGFPRVAKGTRHYKPGAGARAGRLVFEDVEGEWSIERVEGVKGGPVVVRALVGNERPELLSELIGGVPEPSFKVVFGFGLDELASVANAEGGEIVARLYAANYGLQANPMDARKVLEDRASEQYKSGGSKPKVNALNARVREAKGLIRELEGEALRYSSEQARASELAQQLEPLKTRRDGLESLVRVLSRDLERLDGALETQRELSEQLVGLDQQRAELTGDQQVIDVDEKVIAVAPQLTAVLSETSSFRERIKRVEDADAATEEAERRIATGPVLPAEAQDNVENRTAVDAWAEKLTRLRFAAESAESASVKAAAVAAGSASVAQLAEIPASAGSRVLPIAFAAVAVVVGVAFFGAGVVLSPTQPLVAMLGGVVALLGVVGLVVALLRRPVAGQPALSADTARLRSDAEAARVVSQDVVAKYESATTEWQGWLAEKHLDVHGDDPSAVRQLLDQLKDRSGLLGEVARHKAEANREREAAEAWAVRLVDLVSGFDAAAGQIPSLPLALELAARAQTALDRALAGQAELVGITRELASNTVAREGITDRLQKAQQVTGQVVADHGLDPMDPLQALQALETSTTEKHKEAVLACETLSEELSGLRATLDKDGRDDRMALARQGLEGLQAQAAMAADEYIVDQLAVRLLDGARERFDRERQPEVVRTAGRVFSAMTGERFTGVRIPLDGQEISAVTPSGGLQPAIELSQGTAEQLYLALRVGLISSLGSLGADLPVLMDDIAANYDAQRLTQATSAIAELSALRQVVFFTCHEATAQVLTAAIPGATLVALGQCAPR